MTTAKHKKLALNVQIHNLVYLFSEQNSIKDFTIFRKDYSGHSCMVSIWYSYQNSGIIWAPVNKTFYTIYSPTTGYRIVFLITMTSPCYGAAVFFCRKSVLAYHGTSLQHHQHSNNSQQSVLDNSKERRDMTPGHIVWTSWGDGCYFGTVSAAACLACHEDSSNSSLNKN